MSFSAYPQYKDSGIETLGKIPSHWEVTRLPYVIFENNAGEVIDKNFWGDGSELLYTCAKQPLLSDYKNFPVRKRTGANDLLLTRNGTPYVHLPSQGAIYSNVVQRVSLIPNMDRNFMRSALDVATRDLVGYGVSIASFNYEMWAALRIPFPDYEEQTQIARFLDHETARIDALIEEQQRLIELLKEKRQAVISHAVTKGLDPTVPMKDSGVEWLGEVPAHWERKRLKNISPFITVGIVVNPSDYVAEEGLPFIYGGEVKEGLIEVDKARKISLKDSLRNRKTMLEAGDIVTMRVGYPGLTAVVPPECEGGNCASVMLVKRGGFDSRWLCAVMNSRLVRQQVEVVQYGAAQKQFNIADAIEFWMFKPPLSEQATIAEFVEEQSSIFDELTAESENSMALLQERRSALISAAVTGKIDVRGWQPPASVPTPELAQEVV